MAYQRKGAYQYWQAARKSAVAFFRSIAGVLFLMGVFFSLLRAATPHFLDSFFPDWIKLLQGIEKETQFWSSVLAIASFAASAATLLQRWWVRLRSPRTFPIPKKEPRFVTELKRWILSPDNTPEFAVNLRFVSAAESEELKRYSYANVQAFEGGPFGARFDVKLARNRELALGCAKSLAWIEAARQTIGITAIVPLNRNAVDDYLRGRIRDDDLKQMHVAINGIDHSATLILFMATTGRHERQRKREFVELMNGLAQHVEAVQRNLNPEAPIIIQIENKRSLRILVRAAGFRQTKSRSADGFPIFLAKMRDLTERLRPPGPVP